MSKKTKEVDGVLRAVRAGSMTRRQALKALGLGSLGVVAAPILSRAAMAGEVPVGPGGIPLARPDHPVELPLHRDPIAAGLEPERGGTFNIFNYADYLNPEMMDEFGEMYDVDVQLTVFENMDQAVTRLASGAVNVDVMEIRPGRLTQAVAGDILQPVNQEYVDNLRTNVWDSLQNPFYDVGSQYTVPYTCYSSGIGWRADMVDIDIPSLENPWSVFWQAHDYRGMVGVLNDPREAIALAMFHRGHYDVNTENPALIEQARDDLIALIEICNPRVEIANYEAVPAGRRAIGHTWSGDMVTGAMWYMEEGVDPSNLRYWTGEKGKAPVENDCWAIPTRSRKPVLAHLWMNYMLDNDVAFRNFSEFTGYVPPITAIDTDTLVARGLIPESLSTAIVRPEDLGAGSQQIMPLSSQGQRRYQDAYAAFVAGV